MMDSSLTAFAPYRTISYKIDLLHIYLNLRAMDTLKITNYSNT